MRIERTLRRLLSYDRDAHRCAARDVGHELPRRNLKLLSSFRSQVASLDEPEDAWQAGYRQALLDVVAAYEAAVEPRIKDVYEDNMRQQAYVPYPQRDDSKVTFGWGPKRAEDEAEEKQGKLFELSELGIELQTYRRDDPPPPPPARHVERLEGRDGEILEVELLQSPYLADDE